MLTSTTLVIATRNAHKAQEIQAILGPEFVCHTLQQFQGVPTVVEDAPDFAGNAAKKALELARWFQANPGALNTALSPETRGQVYCVADDSGLEVDALQGAPGVHSARFAALDAQSDGNSADADNNAKLLRLLSTVPDERRTARFRCVIALTPVLFDVIQSASPVCYADEAELDTVLFEGVCEGRIEREPRGARGFGYDPLFVPAGFSESFAELGDDVKNRISHRAEALHKLQAWFGSMERPWIAPLG